MRRWLVIGTLWLVSVVVAGVVGFAQTPALPPKVVSGADLGFVLEGQHSGKAMGHFVVKLNGQWLPVGGAGLIPAR